MSEHIPVRIKGSRWLTTAHRAERKGTHSKDQRSGPAPHPLRSPAPVGEDDLLLNLAVRHFVELQLTSTEAARFAEALTRVVESGRTQTVDLQTSSPHTYEISRRIAAVTIRFGDASMHLPIHAALQLADALRLMRRARAMPDIAA